MVSAIIPTWNSEKYIQKCLDSLISDFENSGLDFEIFVVDNGSGDGTREILNKYQRNGDINLIALSKNTGTTYSRNLAIKEAAGDYILILDSDTEVKPGAVKRLLSVLEGDNRVGIVAPKLLRGDGSPHRSSHNRFPTIQSKFFKILPFAWSQKLASRMESYDFTDDNNPHEVDYCFSALWLLPKKVVDEIGLLDERIFYSPEDVDYCIRMWLGGYSVIYYPAVEVVHHSQRLSRRRIRFAVSQVLGHLYLFRKHRYLFSRRGLYKKIRS